MPSIIYCSWKPASQPWQTEPCYRHSHQDAKNNSMDVVAWASARNSHPSLDPGDWAGLDLGGQPKLLLVQQCPYCYFQCTSSSGASASLPGQEGSLLAAMQTYLTYAPNPVTGSMAADPQALRRTSVTSVGFCTHESSCDVIIKLQFLKCFQKGMFSEYTSLIKILRLSEKETLWT